MIHPDGVFDVGSWTCHICGRIRPDEFIGVLRTDVSAEWGLPPGTVRQNVRYCKDTPACVEGAKTFRFTPAVEPIT